MHLSLLFSNINIQQCLLKESILTLLSASLTSHILSITKFYQFYFPDASLLYSSLHLPQHYCRRRSVLSGFLLLILCHSSPFLVIKLLKYKLDSLWLQSLQRLPTKIKFKTFIKLCGALRDQAPTYLPILISRLSVKPSPNSNRMRLLSLEYFQPFCHFKAISFAISFAQIDPLHIFCKVNPYASFKFQQFVIICLFFKCL